MPGEAAFVPLHADGASTRRSAKPKGTFLVMGAHLRNAQASAELGVDDALFALSHTGKTRLEAFWG